MPSAAVSHHGRRRTASAITLPAAMEWRMPKKMKASGVARWVAIVIAAAAALTWARRWKNDRHLIRCPWARTRLTPTRNRKDPAMLRANQTIPDENMTAGSIWRNMARSQQK